ncbi:hypothetical protein C8247_12090 [Paracidovorax avenae]|nr:hypothetical protein C8247_12090 [Paracidovorax avenae]
MRHEACGDGNRVGMKRTGPPLPPFPNPLQTLWCPDMFRSLLAVNLLVFCCTALADTGVGKLHTFRDWLVGCDNTLRCEAQGYGSERSEASPGGRAALIIRRDAGPDRPPAMHFAYSTMDDVPGPSINQVVMVQVGALRFELPRMAAPQQETEVPASRVPALLAAAQKSAYIVLSVGNSQWKVSLNGAAAALLKMDDLQGRVGTPGALTRKGTKPESSVPLPAIPVLDAARIPPTTPADLKLVPAIAALLPHTESDCPGFDPAQGELEMVRLTSSTLLVLQPCWRGAYQTGSRVWQVDDRPPHRARQLDLPTADGSTQDSLVADSLGGNDRLYLRESAKGRGIGDCWVRHDWTWSGDRLVLVNASESDCRLFESGGLMVDLWRAQLK